MARVITFSRQFPAYHPRAGEQTYFVEKIWKCLWDMEPRNINPLQDYQPRYDDLFHPTGEGMKNIHQFKPKNHTIRGGNRWKVGDKFSPRVWSGKPYNSKQIEIAPEIEIVKVWDFEIKEGLIFIGGELYAYPNSTDQMGYLSDNDGLNQVELLEWFQYHKKDFKGQIICWNESVNY